MTTHIMRNLITVTKWAVDTSGATILYERTDKPGKEIKAIITPIELVQGLTAIASIDEYTLSPITITNDGRTYSFHNFFRKYHLSQWEALNLAIRHEMEFEEAKDLIKSGIGKALEALKH